MSGLELALARATKRWGAVVLIVNPNYEEQIDG